jgi:hypothetical protein
MGGSSLLHKFNGSISGLLSGSYPDYNWLPWKFTRCPPEFWDDLKNQGKFMEWATKQLNIEMSDWHKVSIQVQNKQN